MRPWSSGRTTHAYQTHNSFASGQSTTMVGASVQESLERTIFSEAVQQQTTRHRLPTVLLSSGRSIISLLGSIIISGNNQPCISIQLVSRASVTCCGQCQSCPKEQPCEVQRSKCKPCIKLPAADDKDSVETMTPNTKRIHLPRETLDVRDSRR